MALNKIARTLRLASRVGLDVFDVLHGHRHSAAGLRSARAWIRAVHAHLRCSSIVTIGELGREAYVAFGAGQGRRPHCILLLVVC